MSDKLEKFIRENREKFDQTDPSNQLWGKIQNNLAGQAGAGGGSGAVGAAKGGFAKLSLGMKLAAIGFTTAIIATGTWLAVTSGNGEKNNTEVANGNTLPDQNKIEFVEESSPLVSPPIQQVDISFNDYTIVAEEGGSITTKTGTVIEVPANAFVDENGKPITGEVQLNYREFHDAADVFVSGITMKYNENGEGEDFQTAGMMDLRGRQGSNEVYIAQGKSLKVNMASFAEDDFRPSEASDSRPYNLYYLDEENGNGWKDIGRAEVAQNENKIEGLQNLPDVPSKPSKPMDLNTVKEKAFDFAVDYKQFPELKPFKKIEWLPVDEDYMEKNEWAFEQVWSDAKLKVKNQEKGVYSLTLSNKSRKFKLDVSPALDGKDYERAMADFKKKLNLYDDLREQRSNEEARLNSQANLIRSFEVSTFGIYNCDRFSRFKDAVEVLADFNFEDDVYVDVEKTVLFHVCGANRSLVTYIGAQSRNIKFSASEDNFLLAVLPGGKVAFFGKEDFKNLSRSGINSKGKTAINLQTIDKNIRSADDVRQLLNG